MFMLNSNKPIKVAHPRELANQSMLNGALVIEMVNNSFSTIVIVNFISDIRSYNYKKIQFSITEINIEIKTTVTAVIKNEIKYFLMSEGNTSIAESNLEVLPLI